MKIIFSNVPVLLLLAACLPLEAQTETNLCIFSGVYGGAPAGLLVSKAGFYGITGSGGNGYGSIYSLTPPVTAGEPWKPTTLYTFSATSGVHPNGDLVAGPSQSFYGVAEASFPVFGTIFEFTPSPTPQVSVLYTFSGTDGEQPQGPLVIDKNGNLYGVTEGGGPSNLGVVFELSPPSQSGGAWTETTLYAFTAAPDGGQPEAGLMMDSQGVLYGTTAFGGTSNHGTAFQLTPPSQLGGPWTETVLYSFHGLLNGRLPHGRLIMDKAGNLYGTTQLGGAHGWGTVFQLIRPSSAGGSWTEGVLHSFAGFSDGSGPVAGPSWGPNGVLVGTAEYNAKTPPNCGVVYSVTPPSNGGGWTEKVLYNFKGGANDGCYPISELLVAPSGVMVSTTLGGSGNNGTVFELAP